MSDTNADKPLRMWAELFVGMAQENQYLTKEGLVKILVEKFNELAGIKSASQDFPSVSARDFIAVMQKNGEWAKVEPPQDAGPIDAIPTNSCGTNRNGVLMPFVADPKPFPVDDEPSRVSPESAAASGFVPRDDGSGIWIRADAVSKPVPVINKGCTPSKVIGIAENFRKEEKGNTVCDIRMENGRVTYGAIIGMADQTPSDTSPDDDSPAPTTKSKDEAMERRLVTDADSQSLQAALDSGDDHAISEAGRRCIANAKSSRELLRDAGLLDDDFPEPTIMENYGANET